jgi:hypothetical protein
VEPYLNEMMHLDEWEKKNGKLTFKVAVKAVMWCYVKCGDLPYSEGESRLPFPYAFTLLAGVYLAELSLLFFAPSLTIVSLLFS